MEAHHASLGRRTLEEIRQKRSADRSSRVSSASDLQAANQISENDFRGILSQLKEIEKRNADLEDENKILVSKLEVKEVEGDTLQKRLNDLEENNLPLMKKALHDVSVEKDSAIRAREDLLAQLRTVKKRLKEAEEEQYRAEEDAAALRAELNLIQQQGVGHSIGGIPPLDQIQAMEQEMIKLKSELQQESLLRQREQSRLMEEQLRTSGLVAEKQDLEEKLAALSKKVSEEDGRKAFTMQDREKREEQLHKMAVMVERLESSRQKLLVEIDSQSSEIERLFEENTNLSASYEDACGVSEQWENQLKDCLKQNEELRELLDKVRTERASADILLGMEIKTESGNTSVAPGYTAENLSLQAQLAKEQSRSESLAAEVMQLSSELRHALQAYNSLARHYKPVLRNIEKSLIKMKQESFVTVQ